MSNQFEIQSTIVHFEQISHHENRALVKKLDLDIEEYSDQFDYSGYDYFAINDLKTQSYLLLSLKPVSFWCSSIIRRLEQLKDILLIFVKVLAQHHDIW